jgi:serine/threonine-protein kinase
MSESEGGTVFDGRAKGRVGSVLRGKYRLDRVLGVGGMAAVYAATHRNGKKVAVKILHAPLSESDETLARFVREGHVANAVDHEGAVSILDDDVSEDGSVFLVMELLDGETLEHRWQRKGKRLPVDEVLAVADVLLDILAAAHAKGIIHRDIKPENVFLTRAGGIKLLDFGIARLRELSAKSEAGATVSGSTMGTPAFMPPEQASGLWDSVDARSDLWAIGATMFTLLAGRCVHEAETVNLQLLASMTRFAQPLRDVRADVPADVAGIVDRALAFEKAGRFPDARAMQEAVRRLRVASAPGPVVSTPRLSFPDDSAPWPAEHISFPRGPTLTTGRGLAHTAQSLATPRTPRALPKRAVAAGAGAVAVILFVALLLSRGSSSATKASASASTPPKTVVTATSAAPTAPPLAPYPEPSDESIPLVRVDELPTVGAQPIAQTQPQTTTSATATPTAVPTIAPIVTATSSPAKNPLNRRR